MSGVRSAIHLAQGLGVLSLLAIVAAILALTDIGHGEPDLSLEWNVLRVAALAVIAFHVAALVAMRRALRVLRDS